jgi:hypothetical protein
VTEHDAQSRLMEAIAIQTDFWTERLTDQLTGSVPVQAVIPEAPDIEALAVCLATCGVDRQGLRRVIAYIAEGVAHALLSELDEGNARIGAPPFRVVAPDGTVVAALHEAYVDHLIDTGRRQLPSLDWYVDRTVEREG